MLNTYELSYVLKYRFGICSFRLMGGHNSPLVHLYSSFGYQNVLSMPVQSRDKMPLYFKTITAE